MIRTSKVPLRNKENQIIGILGVYDDITLYKKAEEALRTSESQLSNAMKIAQLGHWEYDVDKDRFTFNDHIYGLLRVTPEQVGGYSMSSSEYAQRFVHPDDAALVAQEIKQAVGTTDPHYNRQIEHRILYGDGEIGYIVVNFFIIKNHEGRTIKTYGVNQDITKRKRAEIALKASEENYRSLIENSVSAIAVLGRDGRILYANPRSIQIWNDPQIIGKTIFDIYPREYALRYSFAIKKVVTTRIGIVDDMETLIGGRVMWFQISMSPLVNSDGSVNSVVLNAWDITERKQAEEELHFRNILLSTQQEASIDGVLVIDENARIISHNRRFVEMWHIPDHLIADGNAERLQQFVSDQVENASISLWQIQNFYDHIKKIGTDEITLSDGRIFNYYSAPMIDMENKYLGRVWFFHDNTEQKRVEAEIRQRNEDLLLMNVLNDAANRDNDVNEIVNIFIREITKVFACNNATLYLMSPDKRYIEMANTALSKNLTSVIEKLIGQPIPRIRISLKQASYFKSVLANQHGTIMSDPKLIQQWIGEFAETSFLPVLIRDAIKARAKHL